MKLTHTDTQTFTCFKDIVLHNETQATKEKCPGAGEEDSESECSLPICLAEGRRSAARELRDEEEGRERG